MNYKTAKQSASRVQLPLYQREAFSEIKEKSCQSLLENIWRRTALQYFSYDVALLAKIFSYKVVWSSRKRKRTLAVCDFNSFTVRVAPELKDPLFHRWLEPLLYHEMCHIVLFDREKIEKRKQQRGKRVQWHGPEFKKLERRHPFSLALDEWIKSGGWERAVRRYRKMQAKESA
ncbi:MAG: hypothetical protein D6780_06620 [Candidatus Dadabacteria bacterium]|nr:MAG: hypothetical protein D6780_06620 [Candidatus Dadabacteria bacterium]